ncbi:NAD-dependent epimerase/dehydratase family protein [Euzebya rosea]|uniref:NAD-dependent epimerase/dehydratase family protein n=1 Tax=Euzebya rosea TaxID=2052804 RepID=UPI000D3E1E7C|nr:NAD-dependent epimerase/dehydratase family protein [Euzebya rosea]
MDQPLTDITTAAPFPRSRVLVTGGSGFIGRSLVDELLRRGTDVVNLDPVPGPGRWTPGDVRDLPADLPTVDAVVHVAGLAGGGSPTDAELHGVNADGTARVVDHAVRTGVRRLVLISSIAVLGPSEQPLDESAPPRPTGAYGRSKLLAERAVTRAAHETGIEVAIVRPGYVFGHDNRGNFGRMVAAIRSGRFAVPGRRDTLKAGIYLPDLVGLLVRLLDAASPPPLVHAVYPDTPTLGALVAMIHGRLEADPTTPGLPAPRVVPDPLVRAGLRALDVAAGTGIRRAADLGETIRKLRGSSNVVSSVLDSSSWAFGWQDALDDLLVTGPGS